jgi:hypothetical protein
MKFSSSMGALSCWIAATTSSLPALAHAMSQWGANNALTKTPEGEMAALVIQAGRDLLSPAALDIH